MKSLHVVFRLSLGLFFLFTLVTSLGITGSDAIAGMHDDENNSYYVEAWVDHKSYTGGCGSHLSSGNSWYIEPCGGRDNLTEPKILKFDMPNLAKVTRVVMYVDLWNVRAPGDVRFAINDGSEHQGNASALFGRTHHIGDIDKSEFVVGENTIKFWRIPQGNTYHVHDVSFRLYYEPNNPPLSGLGSLNAELTGISDGSGTYDPSQPRSLNIDGDLLTLSIGNVSADVDFVEVYGFYNGYDEDNVGGPVDWHSRGRHNCHQGAASGRCPVDAESGLGGTIDHIATVPMTGTASYSVDWDVSLISSQSNVKFKLRTVDIDTDLNGDGKVNDKDNAENVRNTPGGLSAPFDLQRTKAVAMFTIPDFQPQFIQSDKWTATTDRYINLPPDAADFDEAFIVASHYNNPYVSINDATAFKAFTSDEDTWALSIRDISGKIVDGKNKITYKAVRSSPNGEFLEPPGPMIVLRRTTAPGADSDAPWPHRNLPEYDATDQPVNSNIEIQIYDSNSGVDVNTIQIRVDDGSGFADITGQTQITGNKYNYQLLYNPGADFSNGQQVTVKVDAQDFAGNTMPTRTWSFTTIGTFVPADVVSDDFNVCVLNQERWTFVNPADDITYLMNGDAIEFSVPGGTSHNLWAGNDKDAARLIQRIENGNFDIEAKFEGGFSQAPLAGSGVQMHGLVAGEGLTGNDGDFVRYDVEYTSSGIRLYFIEFDNGSVKANGALKSLGGAEPPGYLRMTRSANTWTFYYRYEGGAWLNAGSKTAALNVAEVGIFVGNAVGNPEHNIALDYFFNSDAPISPEDANANVLPVMMAGDGSGQVLRDIYCGNPVTLTAEPDSYSKFEGYSGAIDSLDPQAVVSFSRGDTVTATFSSVYYTVDIRAVDKNGLPTNNGIVTKSAPAVEEGYVFSETVTVEAEAVEGWAFAGWQGDLTGIEPSIQFNIDSNKDIEGVFKQIFTLTNLVAPENSAGTVVAEPPGPEYLDGESVQMTATSAEGWAFTGWIDDADGTDTSVSVVMDSDKTITANFSRVYRLTVDQDGQGSVSVAPQQDEFVDGAQVSLLATPDSGWAFAGWEGDLEGTDAEVVLTMDSNKSVKAIFKRRYELTVSANNGTVVLEPDMPFYLEGDIVKLTPVADDGYAFARWIGDLTGNMTPAQLVMEGEKTNKSVVAIFEEGYGIDTFTEGSGTIARAPADQPYLFGQTVTLTATADPGWEFVGWSGDLVSSNNPEQIVIDANKSITAIFVPRNIYLPLIHGTR